MNRIILLLIFATTLFAQTTANPDISVIGDIIGISDGDEFDFSSSGIELAIQGYVNPFARADVYLHKHNDESSIHFEEGFLSIERGLPLNTGLKVGKMRPDFGKINKEHMHTYYYILPSEVVQSILGSEMWGSIGVEAKTLLPLPWYSNLSVGIFQDGIFHHYHDDDENHEHSEADEDHTGKILSTRLSQFVDLTSVTHLEFGASLYQNLMESENRILGIDYKFKWRPDTYNSFVAQGEYFRKSGHDNEIINSAYAWFNYQFNRIWNAGVIFDYSDDIEEQTYKSVGIFAGFSPVEESSVFRLRLHQIYHGEEDPLFTVVAQVIWSLGPHKPHQF